MLFVDTVSLDSIAVQDEINRYPSYYYAGPYTTGWMIFATSQSEVDEKVAVFDTFQTRSAVWRMTVPIYVPPEEPPYVPPIEPGVGLFPKILISGVVALVLFGIIKSAKRK